MQARKARRIVVRPAAGASGAGPAQRAGQAGTFDPIGPNRLGVYAPPVGQTGDAQAHGEFRRLDRAESLRMLGTVQVGRLIFTINALPAVRPMNFAVVDGLIVLRTAADTTVARKVDNVIVAFEADDLDVATSSGWSVVVTGRATLVSDPDLMARYRNVPLIPWAPGERDQFLTITIEILEGRRISRPAGSSDPGRPRSTPLATLCGAEDNRLDGAG